MIKRSERIIQSKVDCQVHQLYFLIKLSLSPLWMKIKFFSRCLQNNRLLTKLINFLLIGLLLAIFLNLSLQFLINVPVNRSGSALMFLNVFFLKYASIVALIFFKLLDCVLPVVFQTKHIHFSIFSTKN